MEQSRHELVFSHGGESWCNTRRGSRMQKPWGLHDPCLLGGRPGAIYQDAKRDCLQLEELWPCFLFLFKLLFFPDFLQPAWPLCFISTKEIIETLGFQQSSVKPKMRAFSFTGVRWPGSKVRLHSCSACQP